MRIPNVGRLITECWATAEVAAQQSIAAEFDDSDEEFITWLFRSKLKVEVDRLSEKGAFAIAFLKDLNAAFGKVSEDSLSKISRGLIATINFPDRSVERRTGADLGIVFIRPNVREGRGSQLTIDRDYRRGLLCQAKVFRRDSRFGSFTVTQKRLLQSKLGYFVLLLYRYTDQPGERRTLAAFSWQLTREATVDQVSGWLTADRFPQLQDSRQILQGLLWDKIGTPDKNIIEADIAPHLRSSLVIKIGWESDNPGGTVHIKMRSTVVTEKEGLVLLRH